MLVSSLYDDPSHVDLLYSPCKGSRTLSIKLEPKFTLSFFGNVTGRVVFVKGDLSGQHKNPIFEDFCEVLEVHSNLLDHMRSEKYRDNISLIG